MKVILCYPPQRNYQGYGQEKRWLPLGIASLGAYLKKENPDIDIVLLDLFNMEIDDAKTEIMKHIKHHEINIVGMTCFTEQRISVFKLCKDLKFQESLIGSFDHNDALNDTHIKTVVGGPHAFFMAQQIADNYKCVDHVVKGEGEVAFKCLIDKYKEVEIAEKENTIVITRILQEPNIKDLDTLPHAIDGFDMFIPAIDIEAEAPIVFSRGCTDFCTFCSTTKFWKGYRSRSAENVFDEMIKYYNRYGITKFKFHDDASTADIQNWKRLCKLLIENKCGYEYEITARADQFDCELIELLSKSGCIRVAIGIESGNENLRNIMNKRLNIEKSIENIQLLKDAGIEVVCLFIVGYFGETDETINETIDFIKSVKPSSYCCQPLMIFPGTKVYSDLVKDGWIDDKFWLEDKPQPYYTKERTFDKLKEWTQKLLTCTQIKKKKILIASVVNQTESKFELFMESMNHLEIPAEYDVARFFLLHNCEDLKKHLLKTDFVNVVNNETGFRCNETTHEWKNDNLDFVANVKNQILDLTLKNDFDYVFFVDSDILMQKETLKHLVSLDKDIVAEIFWTKWTPEKEEEPNAWDFDHYSFLPETKEKYKTPGTYPCGGTGACILISQKVIKLGVNYLNIGNLSLWGEDRHFSIRAFILGFDLWIDTHYPAFHIYRESLIKEAKHFLFLEFNK